MTYTESDLILPTLALLREHPAGLTTSELIRELSSRLELSEEDKRILKNRSDTHFSQKVRNLVSHKTLLKKELSDYERLPGNGRHTITDKGARYIGDNAENAAFLLQSGFTEHDKKAVIEADYQGFIVEEGYLGPLQHTQKRRRSRKLTQLARQHFTQDGRISCAGCGFNFDDFYGPAAKQYIEIHHLKPIFAYEEGDTRQSFEIAVQNLCPLCANCHRMMHRNTAQPLTLEELRGLIKAHESAAKGYVSNR
jgi:hypothetical protein